MSYGNIVFERITLNIPNISGMGAQVHNHKYYYMRDYPDVILLQHDTGFDVIPVPEITLANCNDAEIVHGFHEKAIIMSHVATGRNFRSVPDIDDYYFTSVSKIYSDSNNYDIYTDADTEDGMDVVSDNVLGNDICYMYSKKYPDVIFPTSDGTIIGFLIIDAGMNMIGMPDEEIFNLQKSKYLTYALGQKDWLYPCTESVSEIIANNSSVYANEPKDTEDVNAEDATLDASYLETSGDKCACQNFFPKRGPKVNISDIDGHPYEEYIQAIVDAGVINLGEGDTFKPDVELTRGQIAVILARILKLV